MPAVTLDLADGAAVARRPQVVVVLVLFYAAERPADADGGHMSALLRGRRTGGQARRGRLVDPDASAVAAGHVVVVVVAVVVATVVVTSSGSGAHG